MTDIGSVFSKGGGGTNFEQYIQTAFLTSMLVNGNVPGIKDSKIIEIAFQATRLGYKTDDLFIRCNSPKGEHRIVAQIKHEFSFTTKNETFKEVINQLWLDFNNNEIFNPEFDKLFIIKENLNKAEANNVKSLINWAKSKSSASDFFLEIKRIRKKEETLNVFRTVIEEINTKKVTEEIIWNFFKCLEMLAYDFGNHASTHQAYYLNLIKLAKNPESRLNENEIWSVLFEFVALRNKDGGLIDIKSIAQEVFFNHFNISNITPVYRSIDKLRSDSELVLNQLSNEIHGLHLERFELKQKITESIQNNKLTIITGNPGVGKSAIINDVLKEEFSSAQLFVFRSDQLNMPHLSNVFSNLGINNSIEEIFATLSLAPQKIIFIDSLEKLLEGDSENAFKQLYNILLKYPDIKIIAASRKYALELINFRYGIQNNEHPIEVNFLSEYEINLVKEKFPQLNELLENTKITTLLKSPKYIDYTLSLLLKDESDNSTISLTEFKSKLWNHIVENITNRKQGLPRKRGNAFLKIAVERAKRMQLFIEPIDIGEEVIDELENDNIIFRDKDNYWFSPSHDILEDWALIRFVEQNFTETTQPNDFFTRLGNEPAIRRAFRLWVEDALIDSNEKIIELVTKSIKNEEIERFWADEVLVAIFKSNYSQNLFDEFQTTISDDNYSFLKRCIHLIRTTCKERATTNSNSLVPIGSGWSSTLKLISERIQLLDELRPLIVNFLLDWEMKIYSGQQELPPETVFVKDILIHYLTQVENGDKYWFSYSHDNKYEGITNLFFSILSESKEFALKLINNALQYEYEDRNWQLRNFYEKVIENCLSGIYSRNVVNEFPDKICEIAWKTWKYVPPQNESWYNRGSSIGTNEYFGLKDHLDDFPASIYMTPFWNMLWSHTYRAFDFITEFLNYCCDNYIQSSFAKDENIIEVKIHIEGKIVLQNGSFDLWKAYRGTGRVIPDVIRSILISLEKYLLTIASWKNETSKKLLKRYFKYLIERSNNVTITSVLASVSIAYPQEVKEGLLFVLGTKEFYRWDSNRAVSEHAALAPMDFKHAFIQKENVEHNQLPHRKKYQRGLIDFITEYQFMIGTLNKEIHQIFDGFWELDSEDIVWKKSLNEMDVRKWEAGEYDKDKGHVLIQPKYEKEVKTFVDSNKIEFEEQNTASVHSLWAMKKYKNEDDVSSEFENWSSAFLYLTNKESFDSYHDKPCTMAHIGLRDFRDKLDTKQLDWCVEILVKSLSTIQSNSMSRSLRYSADLNPIDREPCLKSFSLIFKEITPESKEEHELAILLFYCLINPIARHEKKYLIEDFRDNLWDVYPKVASTIWKLLISYSTFKKKNHYFIDEPRSKRTDEIKQKEFDFINSQILNNIDNEIQELNLKIQTGHFLMQASILVPFDTTDRQHIEYIESIVELFFDAIYVEDHLHSEFKKIEIQHEDQTELNRFLSKYLLLQNPDASKLLLDKMLSKYYLLMVDPRKASNINKFIRLTLELTICEFDYFVNGINKFKNISKDTIINNFWSIWDFLNHKITDSGNLHFSSLLFLDIDANGITWDENFKDWEPLKGREKHYKKLIKEKGHINIKAILNIFVSIGHTRLLPNGLNWLVDVLKENPERLPDMMTLKGERLIENLFHFYCMKIKGDNELLNNYVWLLDNMIDFGSSKAYLVRENVITYKTI